MSFEDMGKRARASEIWQTGDNKTAPDLLTGPSSHGSKHWGKQSRIARLEDAIVEPEKPNNSYFENEADFRLAFCANVCANATSLAAYSMDTRPRMHDCDNKRRDQAAPGFVIRHNPVTNRIAEYHSNQTTLVVRSCSAETRFAGMQYITFYPGLQNHTLAYQTGRDLRDDLTQTPSYKKATPLGKAWLETMCDPEAPEVKNRYTNIARVDILEIPLSPTGQSAILMTSGSKTYDEPKIKILTKDGKEYDIKSDIGPKLLDAIARQYPQQHNLMKWICAAYKKPYTPSYEIDSRTSLPDVFQSKEDDVTKKSESNKEF